MIVKNYPRGLKLVSFTFLLVSTTSLGLNAMTWNEMDVVINNIDTARKGKLVVMVFKEAGFPKEHDKAIKSYLLNPIKAEMELSVQVPEGEFAIKVHHDEDGNGKLTKDWTGFLPAEGLGFSAGARLLFGPPSFSSAKIEMPESKSHRITVRYP